MKQLEITDDSAGFRQAISKVPGKGMRKAAYFFHARTRDPERKAWIEERKRMYGENQILFLDQMTPIYIGIMEQLPAKAQAIMHHVALAYAKGIRIKDLAQLVSMSANACSATVRRMATLGLLSIERTGRETSVKQTDMDFLRFAAMRWDQRSRRHIHGNGHDCIDRYIESQS